MPLLTTRLAGPGVEVDAELLELLLDLPHHQLHRIALAHGDLLDVRARVAVLRRLLSPPPCLDRLTERVDLPADVVVVVLALDRVAGKGQQARDRVAVRAVSRRADCDRTGRVGRYRLHLNPLKRGG